MEKSLFNVTANSSKPKRLGATGYVFYSEVGPTIAVRSIIVDWKI